MRFAFRKTNVVLIVIEAASFWTTSFHCAESIRSSTGSRTTIQTSSQHLHDALSLILLVPNDTVFSVRHGPNLRSKSTQQRNRKRKWRPSTFHWTTRPSEWEIYSRASIPRILPCPPPPIRCCLPPNAPPSTPSTPPPSIPTSTWISWFALTLCCLCSELKCLVLVEMNSI
jgi:hypothetical protein